MSEQVVGTEEEKEKESTEAKRSSVTEEIKVQAQDLVDVVNRLIREGTIRRITVVRNDRTLVDIPLVVGLGASVALAIYLPVLSAIAAVGALLGGCTVRVEREEPPTAS
jgi:DNA-binding Lrp family transcriptional regulator